jgi:hypothetical protein
VRVLGQNRAVQVRRGVQVQPPEGHPRLMDPGSTTLVLVCS